MSLLLFHQITINIARRVLYRNHQHQQKSGFSSNTFSFYCAEFRKNHKQRKLGNKNCSVTKKGLKTLGLLNGIRRRNFCEK